LTLISTTLITFKDQILILTPKHMIVYRIMCSSHYADRLEFLCYFNCTYTLAIAAHTRTYTYV